MLGEFKIKLSSFINRVLRYLIFSTLLSSCVTVILLIVNLFAGVVVSLSLYFILFLAIDFGLTVMACIYNYNKLLVPLNKPLIMKLEKDRVERARMDNRRKKRKSNKKVS